MSSPMTTRTQESITTAKTLADGASVSAAIDAIVAEIEAARASITAVRPGRPELAAGYRDYIERHTSTKGRAPYYSYIGSGVGNGPLVQLADGSTKWDMINGIGVHMFGHSDPDLVATALRAALGDTVMQGNLQFNPSAIECAEFLLGEASHNSRLAHCFLINSGALANESALKLCFQHNAPAGRVLAFRHCFAGRTVTMAQIGDAHAGRVGVPLTQAVDYVPFFDPQRPEASAAEAVARLDEHIDRYPGGHACFSMELIQGEGGFNVAPREFFLPLLDRCRDRGIGVWFDEIQTFGRTESMFYFDQLRLGEYADVVTIGKLSQICACLYTADYNPKPGLLSATFVGSTVALRVGQRMMERLRDGGCYGPGGRIARLQEEFRRCAADLVKRRPEWFPSPATAFGGTGGMMRLTPFGGDKDAVLKTLHVMFDDGVIAFYCGRGPYHIRFLPAVGVMEPSQWSDVFRIVEGALARTAT